MVTVFYPSVVVNLIFRAKPLGTDMTHGAVFSSPARWYVSQSLKMILVHLLENYDFKLADPRAPRTFFWTTAVVPRASTALLIRPRGTAHHTAAADNISSSITITPKAHIKSADDRTRRKETGKLFF
jgi:hypothetical protein